MTVEFRRALGFGLLAGALGITVLMLLWLATSGAQAGGAVLGLLLLFVLAAPLGGAGWYVLRRARAERVEEQAFAGRRRVLDADRLFRRELSARLTELARLPGVPADQLQMVATSLSRAVADESAWYETIQLDDAQIDLLTQYDDLVWEGVSWLRDHSGEEAATVRQAVDQLRQAIDQRTDLLVRGRRPPLAAGERVFHARPSDQSSADVREIGMGDALSRDGVDYVVEGLQTSFAAGQTSRLAHLVPSGNAPECWLLISPSGLELAWLQSIGAPEPGAQVITVDGHALTLTSATSAIAWVVSSAGSAAGVLVRTWRYRTADDVALVEQWPDGAVVAYGGKTIPARTLEVWPATHHPEAAHS